MLQYDIYKRDIILKKYKDLKKIYPFDKGLFTKAWRMCFPDDWKHDKKQDIRDIEKNRVLDNGFFWQYMEARKKDYLEHTQDNCFMLMLDNITDFRVCESVYDSYRHKIKRLDKRIKDILNSGSKCLFLTLNFKDINELEQDKRRLQVVRFLKKNCIDYIANIDYGSNKIYIDRHGIEREATEREHYHALVSIDNNINLDSWLDYGLIHYEVVHSSKDSKALARYINKLRNHTIKESTKRNQSIIYARKSCPVANKETSSPK